jgi:hypothetical protein
MWEHPSHKFYLTGKFLLWNILQLGPLKRKCHPWYESIDLVDVNVNDNVEKRTLVFFVPEYENLTRLASIETTSTSNVNLFLNKQLEFLQILWTPKSLFIQRIDSILTKRSYNHEGYKLQEQRMKGFDNITSKIQSLEKTISNYERIGFYIYDLETATKERWLTGTWQHDVLALVEQRERSMRKRKHR